MMLAQMLLNDGRADLVLAGGTEAPVNRLGLVGFSASGPSPQRCP